MNWPPEELITARLRVRKPKPGDVQDLFAHLSGDAQVTRYLGWHPHTDLTQTRQQISLDLLRWNRGVAWTWLIEHATQGVGLLQLSAIEPHMLRLGCMLARSRWGRGLMQEALQALLSEAFARQQTHRIEAMCDVDNAASTRMLEKLGMRREGRLARYIIHPNMSKLPRDVYLYAMTRDDAYYDATPACLADDKAHILISVGNGTHDTGQA